MIAISGGGIAGLAAAIAVTEAGHKALLIAKKTNSLGMRGGIQIAPNGWASMVELGVDNLARNFATNLSKITVRDLLSGATLASVSPNGSYSSFLRYELAALLQAKLKKNKKYEHCEGHVVDVVNRGEQLKILLQDGKTIEAKALVAADGVDGFGRSYVIGKHFNKKPRATSRVIMRTVINVSSEELPALATQAASNLWLGNGAHVVHYPLKCGKLINLVVTFNAAFVESNWKQMILGHNEVLNYFTSLSKAQWVKTTIPSATFDPCWRRGNVVLIGDAAHPMPPNLAQGVGQGLADAACLFHCLNEHNSIADAISKYVNERSQAVNKVLKKAEVTSKVMAMNGISANLRNLALSMGGGTMIKSWLSEVWFQS